LLFFADHVAVVGNDVPATPRQHVDGRTVLDDAHAQRPGEVTIHARVGDIAESGQGDAHVFGRHREEVVAEIVLAQLTQDAPLGHERRTRDHDVSDGERG
jgi:hypothetical protein